MKQLVHSLLRVCLAISNTNIPAGKPIFSTFPNTFRYLLFAIVLGCSAPALLAQTTWTGILSTNWNDPGNWMTAAVPTAADDVVIPNTANDPVIMGGTVAVVQSVTIAGGATFTIQSMASLSIEGDANYAIYNEGSVSNSGIMTIGATASPGFYGIRNFDTFDNEVGGNITINQGSIGINNGLGTFTNAGTIKIGDVASLGSTGVYNEADFQNATTGVLEISRTSGSGFYNLATGTLTNAGTITFGKEASFFGPAFYNFNEIENLAGATINVDRTYTAIDNRPNTSFTNEGLIVIGANFSISGPGIYNQNGATFLNTDGEIRIDRFNSAAIDNRVNSIFTTTGLIIIGANEATSGPGIYNYGGNFTNDGGEIRIDRVNSSGINNTFSTVFVNPNFIYTPGSFSNLNNGMITIGANAATAIGGPGIHNESTFDGSVITTFVNNGPISINRTAFGIHNNNYSSFTNAGNITVGDVAMYVGFGGPGINNMGTFMHNDGTIQIDRTNSGIHNQHPFGGMASFTNAAKIIIGSISDITNGPGITNYGLFNNNTGGDISIDRISASYTSAVWNGYGSSSIFNNNGVLKIGTLANIANIGITMESQSTFNNLADGEITIERTATQGIHIASTFNNQGKIDIGLTTNIGERGINMAASGSVVFKNEGELTIDRATVHGIFHGGGKIENSGTIDIGKTAGVGNWGIYVGFSAGTFDNLAGGEINIDNTKMAGLRNDRGPFNNAGKLNIGSLASVGSWGLWNQATFTNAATGEIHINRSTTSGLHNVNFNGNSLFNNFGKIYIGDLAAVGTEALNNYHDPSFNAFNATFRNEACALLEIYAPLNNTDIFVNEGLMRVNTAAAHNNTTGFTNNGVIEYAQVNPIPNVTNNDIIIEPIDALCPSDVIQIGGMNSFTIATTWYEDENLTMPAGTYDAGTNTFTPAGLSPGAHTLYFEITDNVNTCAQIASIQITIYSMGILYVDEDAVGANDGTSWADAYNDLQDALAAACECDGTQIWVADGTYKPSVQFDFDAPFNTDDPLEVTFSLCPGVSLYGGFAGTETDRNDANPAMHKTILSGDLNGDDQDTDNDGIPDANISENAFHVVNMTDVGTDVVFDGFFVQGGNANGGGNDNVGGGIFLQANDGNTSSPRIARSIIRQNQAGPGGGMYIATTGSGIAAPLVVNSVFENNQALQGGGVFNKATATFLNCVFTNNKALSGGAVSNSGNLTLTNCTLEENSVGIFGGGVYQTGNNGNPTTIITNTILWNNAPQQIYNDFEGVGATGIINIATSLLQGGVAGIAETQGIGGISIVNDNGGNKSDDPLFVNAADPDGADNCWRTADDGLALTASSPAINMGNDAAIMETTDVTGANRFVGGMVDMGAYESPCVNPAGTISSNFSAICAGESIELSFTATEGVGTFDIVVNGIPYDNVVSGSVFATLSPNNNTNYTLTQITDNNGCIAADLSQAISVTVTNCQVTAVDPCTCKNNATTLTNGQFNETIQVMNAPTGQTWTVTAVTGLYNSNSAAPPAPPTPITVGTVLTESPAGSGIYILPGVHVDALGYTISVSNGRGITFFLANACVYPNPAITLDPAYCKDEPAILLTGTPGDANIISKSFKIDGTTATLLDPAALTVGNHTIEYTVDGGKAKEFGPNDPGCIQTVSQQVRIDPQVTVDAGSTQTICKTKTLSLAGLDLTVTYTGGNLADLEYSWSIVEAGNNGTLMGTSTTDPKAGTYTPGADAIARGYVTLRLTVDNPNDACDAVSDTLRVNILNVDCGQFPWNGN